MISSRRISQAFPPKVAEQLLEQVKQAPFWPKNQSYPDNYRNAHRFESDDLPAEDEVFTARFCRAEILERSHELTAACERYLRPQLEAVANKALGPLTIRVHRMKAGDHFRAHVDSAMGAIGFTVNLCKGWRWDWGGLLVAIEAGEAKAFLPRFNELVVMDAAARTPHFVTEVAAHAREPRYTLVGFAKC